MYGTIITSVKARQVYTNRGKPGVEVVVTTENGVLAGSTLNMLTAVKNLMNFANAPLVDAIICASLTPAKVIGIDNITGSIEIGKRADISILDKELNLVRNV